MTVTAELILHWFSVPIVRFIIRAKSCADLRYLNVLPLGCTGNKQARVRSYCS